MTLSDPIADMLTRVRNANTVMHDVVRMPASKQKAALAEVLVREGYIAAYEVQTEEAKPGKVLEIKLKYTPERKRTISGLKRVSKPGLRVYLRSEKLPRVLGGLGVAVVSTSQGLLTDKEARSRGLGGEVLCIVW
jgi:small subunit ribosomal protein S8